MAQLTEAVFQRAVYLAKQFDEDVPEYMRILLDGNNPELGDAFTWVAAIEAKLGKARPSGKSLQRRGESDRGVREHRGIEREDFTPVFVQSTQEAVRAVGESDGVLEAENCRRRGERESDVQLLNATGRIMGTSERI